MKPNLAPIVCTVVSILCAGVTVCAQTLSISSNDPPGAVRIHHSFDYALDHTDISSITPMIAVGNIGIFGMKPPLESDVPTTLAGVEGTFTLAPHKFGELTALGPPTMTVISVDFPKPDIYASMNPGDIFKILTASLNDEQWKSLTGPQGLSEADLNTDDQRELWTLALGFQGKVTIHKDDAEGHEIDKMDITNKLDQVRIHLNRKIEVILPTGENEWTLSNTENEHSRPQYTVDTTKSHSSAIAGFNPRMTVENTPKQSDIDFDNPALDAQIDTAGAVSVGALLTKIGAATRMDLVCDMHMELLPITMRPAAARVRAGDLLRAIAFDVSGAYRKVGPLYILTNDVMGLGTKAALIKEYELRAQTAGAAPVHAAGEKIGTGHTLMDLSLVNPKIDFTQAQLDRFKNEQTLNFNPSQMSLQLAPNELSPSQLAQVESQFANAMKHTNSSPFQPKRDGKIMLNCVPILTAVMDGLDGDLRFPNLNADYFFEMPQSLVKQRIQAAIESASASPDSQWKRMGIVLTGTSWKTEFVGLSPRRALRVTASTPKQAAELVTQANILGFNELWFNVFPAPQPNREGTTDAAQYSASAVLTAALNAAKPLGIGIYAHIDLLRWPPTTSPTLRDRDIRGDDSAEAQVRNQSLNYRTADESLPDASALPVLVSPSAAVVRQTLLECHDNLRTLAGLSGVVWDDAGGPGYFPNIENRVDKLGYTVDNRVDYILRTHVDPIDLYSDYNGDGVDLELPFMSDIFFGPRDPGLPTPNEQNWENFRESKLTSLLKNLSGALYGDGRHAPDIFPIIAAEQTKHNGTWYGTWDSTLSPLPRYHQDIWAGPSTRQYPRAADKQAKMESRRTYALCYQVFHNPYPVMVSTTRASMLGKSWNGLVVKLVKKRSAAGTPGTVEPDSSVLASMIDSMNTLRPGTVTAIKQDNAIKHAVQTH